MTSARLRAMLALACAGALSALPCAADDSRYQDYPVGSRAMALGGAFVAIADDPSGLTYNPAGICDVHRLNVSVSASLYGIERTTHGDALINGSTFSLATLAELNVIPGDAGFVKGFGQLDTRGSQWAFGFDVTVPSFRTYGLDQTTPDRVHNRVTDRTFDVAVGMGYRATPQLNLGAALHGVLRQYDQSADAFVTDGAATDPTVGTYTASSGFTNANLVLTLGAKWRTEDDHWLIGLSTSLPGLGVYSTGHVSILDVVADPHAPTGQQTIVRTYDTTDAANNTPVPFMVRVGAARVEPGHWTLSGQLTFHAGTTYERFDLPPDVEDRLRIQGVIQRSPVLDLNLGGEYLLNKEWSIAGGFFTSNSGAQDLKTLPDGSLDPTSSRLAKVSLIGGTATLGMLGEHAISRLGVSVSYGSGQEAVANDPTGVFDPDGFTKASVKQLFLYVFLASTFRY